MPPKLAAFLCILFIVIVLFIDVKRKPQVSGALWIPLVWFMIMASRPVELWFSTAPGLPTTVEEGSAVNRAVLTFLMLLGIFVLSRRPILWGETLRINSWVVVFFLYCALSVIWSDFPDVAAKRWIRVFGCLIMIFVVSSETDPIEARRTLILRTVYVFIPLSILLIKYYPEFGVYYNQWTGQAMFKGVTTDKNALGRLCLIAGIFFLWKLAPDGNRNVLGNNKLRKAVKGIYLCLAVWLLFKSGSATSLGAFVMGFFVYFGLGMPVIKRNLTSLGKVFMGTVCVMLFLEYAVSIIEVIISSLGRDMTLTERTYIWHDLMKMGTNPLVGIGYDSFWLGERLQYFINKHGVNEAHNGYLAVYLELGIVGLVIFAGIIAKTYVRILKSLSIAADYGRVQMTFFLVFLVYNITETASKLTTTMFFILVLLSIEVSRKELGMSHEQGGGTGKGIPMPNKAI